MHLPSFLKRNKQVFIVLLIFLGLWAIFFILNPKAYAGTDIYSSLMSVLPFTLLPALALTFLIIAGEIDLSFPSVMGVGAWIFSLIWILTDNPPLAFLGAIAVGLLAGLMNGLLVCKVGIPSLILTIGTFFLWRGVVMVGTQGYSTSLLKMKENLFYTIFVGKLGMFPAQAIWSFAITVILYLVLSRHKFGMHVYFTGDNIQAARLMGVNVHRVKIICFMLVGIISSFAGVLVALYMLSFWPGIGEGYLLLSIASVVVGGTSIFGGSGSIVGTLIGAHIITWMQTGLLAGGISGFWVKLAIGVTIILALIPQGLARRTF